ncbi:MAG: monovalent cation/H(+) antiporter subunit G [Lachnospiraceae bacterium]|nr:monovalent cation/H(+) antiporter subunit G [Lachnospiraceae bacterium]
MIVREILAALFFILGTAVYITATIGIFKFKYVLNRMHVAAIGDTLGLLLITIGGVCYFGLAFVSLKIVLVLLFLWFSSPVASHFIANLEYIINPDLVSKEYKEETIDELRKEEE